MGFSQSLPETLNLPTISPTFNWNFVNGKILDSHLTFSRNSTVASHFNELKNLVSDVANIPRFNHDLGISKGLLLEKASTNYCLQSEDISNASWTKSEVTVSSNAVTFIDGLLTADILIPTTNNTSHLITQTISGQSTDTEWTFEVVIKSSGYYRTVIDMTGASGRKIFAYFNAATGLMTSSGAQNGAILNSTNIKNLGNGFYKISISGVLGGGTTSISIHLYVVDAAGTTGFAGDGTSGLVVCGARFSDGRTDSYIKTTTAAVTRALDLLTVSTTNFNFYRQDEFSVFVKFIGQAIGTCTIFSFHNGTANERIHLESIDGTLTFKLVDGGVEQCNLALGTVITGTEYSVAVAWKLNDIAASINGAIVVTDTNATLPTVTQLSIGCNYAGVNQMNAEIALIQGWATRLNNSQLEVLSS